MAASWISWHLLEGKLRLIKFTRGDGSIIFINPLSVRTVSTSDRTFCYIHFDNDNVVMVKETAERVAEAIQAGD